MDLRKYRWQTTEALCGTYTTWWHYNRYTVLLLVWLVLALLGLWHTERLQRLAAQKDAAQFAASLTRVHHMCYLGTRTASVLIVGGSPAQVDEGLRKVTEQADELRIVMLAAKEY